MTDRPQWPVGPAEAMYPVSDRSLTAQVAQLVDIARAVAEAALIVGITAVFVVLAAIGGILVRAIVRRGDAQRARAYVERLLARPLPRSHGRHRVDWRSDDGGAGRKVLNVLGLVTVLSVSVVVCVGAVVLSVAD